MQYKYFFLLFLFVCASCKMEDKHKIDIKTLAHNDLNLKDEYIGRGGMIAVFDDGIIGMEEAESLAPFYFLSFKDKGIRHFGQRGQGPDDFLRPFSLQYLDEQTFGTYDMMKASFFEVRHVEKDSSAWIANRIPIECKAYRVIKTAFNQYMGLSAENGLFAFADSSGKCISEVLEYPYRDSDERAIKNRLRSMAYQGTLAANPDGSRCVYAPMHGEIIHFYEIGKSDASLIHKTEKVFPKYITEDNPGQISAASHRDNLVGYISLAATNRFVYALYSGKTINEQIKANRFELEAKTLRIFDWNGTLVSEYRLDIPCRYIDVEKNDRIIHAVAVIDEVSMVSFDLAEAQKAEPSSEESTDTFSETGNAASGIGAESKGGIPKPIDVGHLRIGEEALFSFLGKQDEFISISTTSSDLQVELNAEKSIIDVKISKFVLGRFSDTLTIECHDGTLRKYEFVGDTK